MAKKKPAPPLYDPPSRHELEQWYRDPKQRVLDWRNVFSGVAGQRVLYDLVFSICGVGTSPRPSVPGRNGQPEILPDPNGVLLSGAVGRQEIGFEILRVLSIPLQEATKTNIERFSL